MTSGRYVRFQEVYVVRKRYGFWRLFIDFILVCATGGLWLIWLLIKFLRNGRL